MQRPDCPSSGSEAHPESATSPSRGDSFLGTPAPDTTRGPSDSDEEGLSYLPVADAADPGDTQHATSCGRSGGPCGKPGPARPSEATPGGTSSSLDDLETSSHAIPDQSRPQVAIHAPFSAARHAVWSALAGATTPPLRRRATKLAKCCRYPTLRAKPCGEIIVCPLRCRDRCCPHCARFRAREATARVLEACQAMNAVRFITLTVPHVDHLLIEQLASLRAAFGRLRRSVAWRAHVNGGVYGIEVKLSNTDGRWHPHLHVIADGRFFPQAALLDAWRAALDHPDSIWKLAPDAPLFAHIEAVHDRRDVATYVGKYIAKPSDLTSWPPSEIRQFAIAMMGQRLLNTFGSLHGTKLDPRDANDDPAATTHVASLQILNIAAERRQRSAMVALFLFRLAFPKLATWTRPDLLELPPDTLRDGESVPNALARVAASAEREFWARIERRWSGPPTEATRKPPPPSTLGLPYPEPETSS